MRRAPLLAALTCLWAVGSSPPASAAFQVERVATGLSRPVFLTAPPGDTERVFILEQHTGEIRILHLTGPGGPVLDPDPFLVIGGLSTGNEQGLLGLAFDPDYASNGFFYAYITTTAPDTEILRFQVSADPDEADAASETLVLRFSQPQGNHNGGWMAFAADDLLYIASGDGGGSDDNDNNHTVNIGNAQDTTKLLGKILRIDPSGDDFPADPDRNYAIPAGNPFAGGGGAPEIWAYGLRNPWRASFDRATGDLYIGDVGQGACEEVDVQPASSTGGENYGWRLREGTIATPTGGVGGPAPVGAIDPIFDYPSGSADCSDPGPGFSGAAVTGGYVYRGPVSELDGRYFFADFLTAEIWSLVWDGSAPSGFDGTNYTGLTNHDGDPDYTPDVGSIDTVSSFGEDAAGNLYILELGGEVFRLPEPAASQGLLASVTTLLGLARKRRRVQS